MFNEKFAKAARECAHPVLPKAPKKQYTHFQLAVTRNTLRRVLADMKDAKVKEELTKKIEYTLWMVKFLMGDHLKE